MSAKDDPAGDESRDVSSMDESEAAPEQDSPDARPDAPEDDAGQEGATDMQAGGPEDDAPPDTWGSLEPDADDLGAGPSDASYPPEPDGPRKGWASREESGPRLQGGIIIGIIAAVGVAAFFAGTFFAGMGADQLTEEDLDRAISKLELRLMQDRLPTAEPAPPVPVSADDDPIIGDPNAPITIIEFSDFECPFCARFYEQTLPQLESEYIDQGKVNLVFRDFPLQNIHPNAVAASLASECADDQNKFKMHDLLFDEQSVWSRQNSTAFVATLSGYAAQIGIDQAAFDSCVTGGTHLEEISKDLQDGQSYGVSGTPGFFIGNEEIGFEELRGAQPYSSFKRIIDLQLGLL